MAIPIGSLVRVNWMGRCFGQRIILTTGYQKTGGPVALTDAAEINGLMDELVVGGVVDILSPYMACLPATYSMEELRGQCVYLTRTTSIQRVLVTPGTHADPATVANDSACITLKGPFAGANRRSNKHIGPLPDAASAAGLLVAGMLTKLGALGDALIADAVLPGGEVYIPSVWRIDLGFVPEVFPLDAYTIGLQSRVQRRRTVGLGE